MEAGEERVGTGLKVQQRGSKHRTGTDSATHGCRPALGKEAHQILVLTRGGCLRKSRRPSERVPLHSTNLSPTLTPRWFHLFFGGLCESGCLRPFPPHGWTHRSAAGKCRPGVLRWRLCLQNTLAPRHHCWSVSGSPWQTTRLPEMLVDYHDT